MRTALSNFLANKALENPSFYVLSGDHGYALFDEIRRVAPAKFLNTGVTEQAMVGCSAGMTKAGMRVAIYGLSAFIPMRVLEFIKMNICYESLPVIILGDGAGTVYTTLGASHQCLEDIACLRSFPIDIYSPADAFEMKRCLDLAYASKRPSYIRIGKADRPSIQSDNPPSALKHFNLIAGQGNSKIALLGTGSMAGAAQELATEFHLDAYSCPLLFNFDNKDNIEILKRYSHVITLEEHSILGGLGSLVGDLILDKRLNTRLSKLGATKMFTYGCGSYEYALKDHGLDLKSLKQKIEALIKN